MIERIEIWGDSVAKGVVYDEGRGRYCITPDRCIPQLEQALALPVKNHARMGATAPEGLADYLQSDALPGAVIVIEYGGNDCDMPWAEVAKAPGEGYYGRVPVEEFEKTLVAFVDAARSRKELPLLVTPPPLEAQRYFDWVTRGIDAENVLKFLGDVQHIYRWQERYSNAVRRVAERTGCTLFDMRTAFLDHLRLPTLYCLDGIHPNAEGHALIVQAVLDAREGLRAQLTKNQG